jgi:hypothetical protein
MAFSDMNYRGPLDAPLSIKQVRHYLRTATSPAEKKVWRDMLNGPEYNKSKAEKPKKDKTDSKGKKK